MFFLRRKKNLLHFNYVLFGLFILISFKASANDFIEYHTTNIQILKGWNYKIGQENRAIATFEHFNRFKYGDFYMFADGTRYDQGKSSGYGEISPRISLSKVLKKDFSNAIVKDYLFSTNLEKGKGDNKVYLYGGAVDFRVPGFSYFKTNLYIRDNPNIVHEQTWQLTFAFKRPFKIKNSEWVIEGFADFTGSEGSKYAANEHIVPRILMDIGSLTGHKKDTLFAGFEWEYWHNKFGQEGVTESNPQLQLKWKFD